MRKVQWLVAATVLSLAVAAGCKKDEPQSSEPAQKAAEQAEEKAEKQAEAAEEQAEAAEEKAEAAEEKVVEAAEAGGDKKIDVEGAAEAGALVPGSGLWGLDVPADAIGMGSLASFDALYDLVKAKADKFGVPLPLTKEALLAQAQGMAQLKSMDWFATDRPIHVIAWNPKKIDNGLVALPMTDKDKAIAALPDTKIADADGNAFKVTIAGKPAYLNFVPGYVVASGHKDAFAAGKDFAARVAVAHKPEGQLEVRVAADNLRTIYADEIQGAKGQIDALKPMLKKELEQGMPMPGMAGLDGVIDFYTQLAQLVVDETQALTWHVKLDGEGNLALPLRLQAKPDGKIAKFAGSMAKADLSFIKSAPKASWMLFGGQMDPKAFDGVMSYATDMMGGLLKLTDEEKVRLTRSFETMTQLQDGKTWFAFYADGQFPMAMASEAGVTDGAKYRAEMDAYMDLVMGKALAMAKEFMPPQFQSMPLDDFGKLVEALNNVSKNLGVTLASGTTTEGEITVQKLVITLDMEMIAKVAGPEKIADVKRITDLLGTKLEFAIAYGPKKVGMAMGPNGVKVATEIAGGNFNGGADEILPTIGENVAMFTHLDVNAGVAAFMPVLKEFGVADQVPAFQPGTSAGFAMGAKDNTLSFKLYGTLDKFVDAGMKAAAAADRAQPEAVPAEPAEDDGADAAPEGDEAPAAGAGRAVIPE